MAQFRTTADIMDHALNEAGEVTNGNSAYEAQLLRYLNKVHYAIVAGGTIPLTKDQTVEVNEVWPWARSKSPLILELQPPYTTGTISLIQESTSGTFSTTPTSSYQGWYIHVDGREDWVKIAQHNANEATFSLDAPYPDSTGATLSYLAAKLDYTLVPSYIVINTENNYIQFRKTSGGATITGTLTAGTYTPATLATHVALVMTTAASGPVISGSYSTVTRKFSFVSDGAGGTTLQIVGNGSQSLLSAHKVLGFDDEISTAGLTQTSTYILGGIARLIEPIQLNKGAGAGIFGLDVETFKRDYPLSSTSEGFPTKFTVIREDSDGNMVVRFDNYPSERTRIEVDFIPVPRDLKDDAASIPLIPRKHVDVLEDAATFRMMLNKSDDRAQAYAAIVSGKITSMISQYRGSLIRFGENFGRVVPRRDLLKVKPPRVFGSQPSATSSASSTIQEFITETLSYTSFQTAATTITVTAHTLAADRTLTALIIKHSTAFAGTSISALTLDVGILGDTAKFITGFDVLQAVSPSAQDSAIVVYFPAAVTAITITANATGANLSALTAGSISLFLQESTIDV